MLFIKWWLVIFQRYSSSETRFVYALIIKHQYLFIIKFLILFLIWLKCKHWQMYFKQIKFFLKYIYKNVWNTLLYSNSITLYENPLTIRLDQHYIILSEMFDLVITACSLLPFHNFPWYLSSCQRFLIYISHDQILNVMKSRNQLFCSLW